MAREDGHHDYTRLTAAGVRRPTCYRLPCSINHTPADLQNGSGTPAIFGGTQPDAGPIYKAQSDHVRLLRAPPVCRDKGTYRGYAFHSRRKNGFLASGLCVIYP